MSKGAAELVTASYRRSFFPPDHLGVHGIGVASARAGNVIGGGDWAKDRLVVDCVRAWSQDQVVEIRSPTATRPWQHVLEPLSGYLRLAQQLSADQALHGEAFNFGPRSEQNHTVVDVIAELARRWQLVPDQAYRVTDNIPFHEAGLLKLNCDKALFHLRWRPTWNYADTIRTVSDWYFEFYRGDRSRLAALTEAQISAYEQAALAGQAAWIGT